MFPAFLWANEKTSTIEFLALTDICLGGNKKKREEEKKEREVTEEKGRRKRKGTKREEGKEKWCPMRHHNNLKI